MTMKILDEDVVYFGGAESGAPLAAGMRISDKLYFGLAVPGGGGVPTFDVLLSGVSPLTLVNAVKLNYIKAFGKCEQKSVLPDGYTQLEYIESTGTQYIDIDVSGNATFIGTAQSTTNSPTSSQVLFANSGAAAGHWFGVQSPNVGSPYAKRWGVGATTTASSTIDGTTKVDFEITFIQTSQSGTINDQTIIRESSAITHTDWIIFAGTTAPSYGFIGKVWKLKVVQNGVLVRNLIPAKQGTDVGMYDLVSGDFFTNQGTGDFTAGGEATPSPDNVMPIWCNNGEIKYSANMANVIADNIEVGKYISAQGVLSYSEFNFTYTKYIPVKPNTTYTLSFSSPLYFASVSEYNTVGDSGFIIRQTKYSTSLTEPFDLTEFTFTTGATTNYIRWGSNMYKSVAITLDDVLALNYMLAESATAVPYAPYVSDNGGIYYDGTVETVSIDTTGSSATCQPLLSVGTYKDSQNITNGAVTRNVGIKVLDGTEDWTTIDQYSRISIQITTMKNSNFPRTLVSYCNYFENLHNGEPISDVTAGQFYLAAPQRVYFHISQATVRAWKEWLASQYAAGTPVIIVYPFATPTTETVTGQTLTITQGTNVVTAEGSVDDLELKISYKAYAEVTVEEIEAVNTDENVEVTIS